MVRSTTDSNFVHEADPCSSIIQQTEKEAAISEGARVRQTRALAKGKQTARSTNPIGGLLTALRARLGASAPQAAGPSGEALTQQTQPTVEDAQPTLDQSPFTPTPVGSQPYPIPPRHVRGASNISQQRSSSPRPSDSASQVRLSQRLSGVEHAVSDILGAIDGLRSLVKPSVAANLAPRTPLDSPFTDDNHSMDAPQSDLQIESVSRERLLP